MPRKKKQVPKFSSEDEEREFCRARFDRVYRFAEGRTGKISELRPTLRIISLRLPVSMIEDLKPVENRRDVPYESLLKVFLAERLAPGCSAPSAKALVEAPFKRACRTVNGGQVVC